jgi:hypothetical protein
MDCISSPERNLFLSSQYVPAGRANTGGSAASTPLIPGLLRSYFVFFYKGQSDIEFGPLAGAALDPDFSAVTFHGQPAKSQANSQTIGGSL